MGETLGIYISVPFCVGKCTFCNFASDAFAPGLMPEYLEALRQEIRGARERAAITGARLPDRVDSVYLGGGTPSLLSAEAVRELFRAVREQFLLAPEAEITAECAPGQIGDATLEAFMREGVNRISLGVQSFVDGEAAAAGRRHTAASCRREIERVRAAGVGDIGVDLIAGLPGQTAASWDQSLIALLASGATHASVYLLELDEDSRLGREALGGGTRYGAGRLPDEEETAALYEQACDVLPAAGLRQYEISNFARAGRRSRHNIRYWRREPYFGFGLDAHSMLPSVCGEGEWRFANTGELGRYVSGFRQGALPVLCEGYETELQPRRLGLQEQLEESLFLGLRMTEGVSLAKLPGSTAGHRAACKSLREAAREGLVEWQGEQVRLTARGRLLSNEVFAKLLELETA